EAVKAAVEKKRDSNPDTTLQGANSVYSLVPTQQDEKMQVVREIQKLLEDDTIELVPEKDKADLNRFKDALAQTNPVLPEQVPEDLKKLFLGEAQIPGTVMLVLAKPKLEMDNGRNAIAFADEISRIPTPLGEFQASSDAIVFGEVLKTMFRDSKKVLV